MRLKTRPVSTRVTLDQYDQLLKRARAQGIKLAQLIYERLEPLFKVPPPPQQQEQE